jgi:hypothetical protein
MLNLYGRRWLSPFLILLFLSFYEPTIAKPFIPDYRPSQRESLDDVGLYSYTETPLDQWDFSDDFDDYILDFDNQIYGFDANPPIRVIEDLDYDESLITDLPSLYTRAPSKFSSSELSGLLECSKHIATFLEEDDVVLFLGNSAR